MSSILLIFFIGILCGKANSASVCYYSLYNSFFNGPTGSVESPNYPSNYSNNVNCFSRIDVSSGETVAITFSAFNTQPGNDYLTITCDTDGTIRLPRYSGTQVPTAMTIPSCNHVRLAFYTDGSVTNTGFSLAYSVTKACADTYFVDPTGTISSPNYPSSYANSQDCNSYIAVSAGHTVIITFVAFSTQSSYDWVKISCASGTAFTSSSYSGSQIPAALTILSCNVVKVYFHSDSSSTYSGFRLTYNMTAGCANTYFSGPTGTISSPNYPNNYANNQDCNSYISIPAGHTVFITFVAFYTQSYNDFVKISCASGTAFTSSSYSGSQIPAALTISSCSRVKVYFHSDSSSTYSGFSLTYNLTSACADTYFSGPTGTISSPNYPNNYVNNQDCYSYIAVPAGHTVIISFVAFYTQSSYDWVKISCASGAAFTSSSYQGSQIPAALTISSCNLVKVHFHSDYSSTYSGFSLTYNVTTACADKYFSGPTGTITSPNYPNNYVNNQDCYSYIAVPAGHTVIISFVAFYTQSSYDFVKITCAAGTAFSSPEYTGSYMYIPDALKISSCNLVKVFFHSDNFTTYSGFSLTYNVTSACANTYFSGSNGTISSPDFPNSYANNLDCHSFISIPSGHTVVITFVAFYSQSPYDWVKITCASGNAFASSPYTGLHTPAALTIASCNLVNVYFHSDSSITYSGFSLTYNMTSGCANKYFSSSTGVISSPNHPGSYANNLDCYSYISIPSGHTVIVAFVEFRTQSENDWTTITCASGTAFTSSRYSGHVIPPALTISACDLVEVYFHTDASTTYTGFSLTYKITPVCDDRHFADPTGTISSPNYPLVYANNLDCYDYISVPSGHSIIITFSSFDTQRKKDWVAITCTNGNTFTASSYSGSQIPANLTISSCSLIKVHFHSDSSVTNKGFSIGYNITSDSRPTYQKQESQESQQSQVFILGGMLGVTILTVTVILAILLGWKCLQRKRSRPTAADVGQKCDGNEHELQQREEGESNLYSNDIGKPAGVAQSEYDNPEASRRRPPAEPAIYQALLKPKK